jgi:hypothetical protein
MVAGPRNFYLLQPFGLFRVVVGGERAKGTLELMSWSRRLPKPLYLNDGRTIATLAQARDAMLALSRLPQTNPHWRQAADLLLEAAYRGRQDPILDAGMQLSRALEADGLI